MRPFKLVALVLVLGIVANLGCGGGGNSNSPNTLPPVVKAGYGQFRSLVPKTAKALKGTKATSVASIAVSTNIAPRANHRSLQMMDGRVLLVGGDMNATNPTMDIFNPATETITRSAAIPFIARYFQRGSGWYYASFAMVNLPDGRVWIGGANNQNDSGSGYDVYEIYDPVLDTLTQFPVDMYEHLARGVYPTNEAYYIGNNQILMMFTYGGEGILDLTTSRIIYFMNDKQTDGSLTDSCTIQDANGDIWQLGGTLMYATSTIAGNTSFPSIYKYDLVAGTWERKHDLITPRSSGSAVLLPGNKIGIYGGEELTGTPSGQKLSSVEVYDIATDTVSATVPLVGGRTKASGVYLQTGYTLISGGISSSGPEDSELVHNTSSNFSGSTGLMTTPRTGHTTTLLNNGLVLVAGGSGGSTAPTTAELFDPQTKLYVIYAGEQIAVNGQPMQFSAKDSSGFELAVAWSVSDPSISTIDSKGLLTPVSEGAVTITASLVSDPTVIVNINIRVLPL